MIKCFAALLAVSSVKNTVQCMPVKYNTSVVYNEGSLSIIHLWCTIKTVD